MIIIAASNPIKQKKIEAIEFFYNYNPIKPLIITLSLMLHPYQVLISSPRRGLLINLLDQKTHSILYKGNTLQTLTTGYWSEKHWRRYTHILPLEITRRICQFLSSNNITCLLYTSPSPRD